MKALKVIAFLIVLLAIGAVFAPWKQWVERGLKTALAQQGVEGVEFHVDALGPRGIVLKDITFGENFTLNEMTVGYSIRELAEGQLKELKASKLVVMASGKEIIAKDAVLVFKPTGVSRTWEGTWTVGSIAVKELSYPLPMVAGEGSFTANTKKLDVQGKVESKDKSHHAVFTVDYSLSDSTASHAVIKQGSLPWGGGILSVKNGQVLFSGKERFRGTLDVQDIPLDKLLRSLTGDRASATGMVTGKVPLVIDDEGTPIISAGNLKAPENGQIILAPDAIPGDNAQLDILRGVLSNFQYKELSMAVASDAQKKLSATLTLQGSNPAMYEGRAVKLNVHLTGDVLSLLQQSVPSFTDPKQLLKQGTHATQ